MVSGSDDPVGIFALHRGYESGLEARQQVSFLDFLNPARRPREVWYQTFWEQVLRARSGFIWDLLNRTYTVNLTATDKERAIRPARVLTGRGQFHLGATVHKQLGLGSHSHRPKEIESGESV